MFQNGHPQLPKRLLETLRVKDISGFVAKRIPIGVRF